jgi:hypothetical protein
MALTIENLPFTAEGTIPGRYRVHLAYALTEDVAGARFERGVGEAEGHQLRRMVAALPVCGLEPADDAARAHMTAHAEALLGKAVEPATAALGPGADTLLGEPAAGAVRAPRASKRVKV